LFTTSIDAESEGLKLDIYGMADILYYCARRDELILNEEFIECMNWSVGDIKHT